MDLFSIVLSCAVALSFVGTIVNSITTQGVKRFIEQHQIMWDERNRQKDQFLKMEIMSEKIERGDRDFAVFLAKYEEHHSNTLRKFDEIVKLLETKDQNNKVVTNGIYNFLENINKTLSNNGQNHH